MGGPSRSGGTPANQETKNYFTQTAWALRIFGPLRAGGTRSVLHLSGLSGIPKTLTDGRYRRLEDRQRCAARHCSRPSAHPYRMKSTCHLGRLEALSSRPTFVIGVLEPA